jgi:hypothetical protein
MKSKCLELILAGALAIPCLAQTHTSKPEAVQTTNRFASATTNELERATYLQSLFEEMPKAPTLIIGNVCPGILYNPQTNELRKIAENYIGQTLKNNNITNDVLQTLVTTTMAEYEDWKNSEYRATTFPACPWLYGKGTTQRMVFKPKIFNDITVQNEEDLKSVMRHELKHMLDLNFGIVLNTKRRLEADSVDPEAFSYLLEFRAFHEQLKYALIENPAAKLSKEHRDYITTKYTESYGFLFNYQSKAKAGEKTLIEEQLRTAELIPITDGKALGLRKTN